MRSVWLQRKVVLDRTTCQMPINNWTSRDTFYWTRAFVTVHFSLYLHAIACCNSFYRNSLSDRTSRPSSVARRTSTGLRRSTARTNLRVVTPRASLCCWGCTCGRVGRSRRSGSSSGGDTSCGSRAGCGRCAISCSCGAWCSHSLRSILLLPD